MKFNSKYEPDSITISERGRPLGWEADCNLLNDLSKDWWEPHRFRITTHGLSIDFVRPFSPLLFEYDCNQEGGSAESFVSTLNHYCTDKGLEVIFAFRAGTAGAETSGTYTRFFMRRRRGNDSSQKFKYHFVYQNPQVNKISKPAAWKKICSIPAHAEWGDDHPYVLFKEVINE